MVSEAKAQAAGRQKWLPEPLIDRALAEPAADGASRILRTAQHTAW